MYHLQTSKTLSSFSTPHPPISAWIMPHRYQQGTQSSFLPLHLREPFRGRQQRAPISPSDPIKASNSKLCLKYRGDCSNRGSRLETELLRRATTHNSCIQGDTVASSCHHNEHKALFTENISAFCGCGACQNPCAHKEGWSPPENLLQWIVMGHNWQNKEKKTEI